MAIKWSDVPTSIKLTVSTVGVLFTAVVWMFTTFETAAGSEAKWNQHNQAIQCRTVFQLKTEIRRYREQLRLDKSLSDEDRAWINDEIVLLQKDIDRLDPKGQC